MPRLLLVGWDAADWKLIRPLLAKGEMPHLGKLIAEGVHGNLATIYPPLSPMVWTSIATGKRPHKHGIHGFTEPTQDGLGVRPIGNLGRRTKAFWNILNQNGKRSIVVGWWPSHPAEPIRGAMVSDRFPLSRESAPTEPLLPGAVWPPALADRLAELRIHGIEITGDILRMFVPGVERVDQEKDQSLHDLACIVAETMSVHAAATELIEHEPWDLAAVYYTGIDHFSHRFMRYHARKRGGDDSLFRDIVANAYRYHDAMLGRLIALAGPDCAVMVLSDHGFHSDRLLPDYIPAQGAGPAIEHRDFGIFCLRAPGVRRGEQIYGASVLDIAPTVLRLFGLPAGQDMDGKALLNAFADQTAAAGIPSWDQVPGDDGRHPPSRQYDGAASAESLQQLVALGYIEPPGEDAGQAVSKCVSEGRYNLALAYIDAGEPGLAADILRQMVRDSPHARYYTHLFHCLLRQRKLAEARSVLEDFDRSCAESAPRARDDLAKRRSVKPDQELTGDRRSPDWGELFERRQLNETASGFVVDRLMLHCRLAFAQTGRKGEKRAARQFLERLAATKDRPDIELFLAAGFEQAGDGGRALEYTRRVRRADPENWQALALEARIHQTAGRHDDAVASAVESLSLVYFQPLLHCLMGISLRRLGEYERAGQEFRVALSQAPGLPVAHDELARLLRRDSSGIGEAGLHMAKAQLLRDRAKKRRLREPPAPAEPAPPVVPAGLPPVERWAGSPPADRARVVTIVTGLPRSGTSMMMQMLEAAGIEIYSDGGREADADNPRGYMEHKQATQLHRDAAWIPAVRGKAVKVVAQLLPYLPEGEEYRLVFLHRKLEEVVASQRAMLARLRRAGARLDDAALMRTFAGQLVRLQNWLQSRPGIQVLTIKYQDAIDDPSGTAARLAAFFGPPFQVEAAAASVDGSLHRQRR